MQQQPIEVVLVKGREKSLLKRHPWVYEKAIARVNGKPGMGDLVRIVGHAAGSSRGPPGRRSRQSVPDAGRSIRMT